MTGKTARGKTGALANSSVPLSLSSASALPLCTLRLCVIFFCGTHKTTTPHNAPIAVKKLDKRIPRINHESVSRKFFTGDSVPIQNETNFLPANCNSNPGCAVIKEVARSHFSAIYPVSPSCAYVLASSVRVIVLRPPRACSSKMSLFPSQSSNGKFDRTGINR